MVFTCSFLLGCSNSHPRSGTIHTHAIYHKRMMIGVHSFQCCLSFPPFFQDFSVKLLSNGMLYYEVCGEGLLAWRSEFCVDDFVLGDGQDGGGEGGGAVFSGIKCKTREKFN